MRVTYVRADRLAIARCQNDDLLILAPFSSVYIPQIGYLNRRMDLGDVACTDGLDEGDVAQRVWRGTAPLQLYKHTAPLSSFIHQYRSSHH
jgi:hypothetical protein